MKIVDCVAFYHLTPSFTEIHDADIEDYELKLKEMKLFVIVVTTNYLLNSSFSKDIEFKFALSHNIRYDLSRM